MTKEFPSPKSKIDPDNKRQINKTFQLQIDPIRSVDDMEKVESIISQKKTLLKSSKDVHEADFVPEGVANSSAFAFVMQKITAWDPKLSSLN